MSRSGLNSGIPFWGGCFDTVITAPLLMTGTVNFPEGFEFLLLFVACENHPPAVRFLIAESINLTMGAMERVGEAPTPEEDHPWRLE